MFGQCWSLNGESDALWRIYSPNKEGLMIETTVKNFHLIKDISYGMLAPIIYYDDLRTALETVSNSNRYKMFGNALIKRKAFEHELEVRLLVVNNERSIGKHYSGDVTRIDLDLDPFNFIDGITIDPRASDWFVYTIQDYCQRLGFKTAPQRSRLYTKDIFLTTKLARKFIAIEDKKDNK